jgi:quinol monooxygenase YgiN
MHVVHVHVHVRASAIDAFVEATLANAKSSLLEPGVFRFDVMQQADDPSRFVLVEIYRTIDDPARHRDTDHYKEWRDTVAEMMAEPRAAVKFVNVFPTDEAWR